MSLRMLAFMVLLTLLFALYGCSAAGQQEAMDVDTPDQIQIKKEDLLEVQAASTPSITQVEIKTTPMPTPTPSPTPITATPTPRPGYLITEVSNEKGYLKNNDVKMREGPGTSYAVVDVIAYYTTLIITGKTEEWYRVEIKNNVGFIRKEFIGVGGIPTPTPTPKPTTKTTKAASTPKPEIAQGEKGDYSDDDIYLVAKLIYAEGKNQSSESFLAMANVLYNRVNSKSFGGTVEKEVYRNGQFSVVDNAGFETLKPSSSALKAAKQVFNEGKRVLPAGVLYFRAAKSGTSWSSSRTFYKTIGGNSYFY